MSRCVSDRRLLQAYYGEGDASKEPHLRTCLRCAGRLQRLTRDLQAVEQALREGAEEMMAPERVMEGVTVAIVRAPGGVPIGFSGP